MKERVDRLFEINERPDIGVVPKKMYAWTIRTERLGEPINAFKNEIVDVPKLGKDEMLVYNMAAGINYNGVWAALGNPKNVVEYHSRYDNNKVDFHICGSESSGIVYEVGEEVTGFKVGDHVVVAGTQYDKNCSYIKNGGDPILSPSFRVWGYEANWGAFAQFSKVQEIQCVPKSSVLNWVEAATTYATGGTAYKMLTAWTENAIKEGDVVLIWGGSGGLGTMTIQLVKYFGGIPIAVVSSDERAKECIRLGAKGCINRNDFNHWGAIDEKHKDSKMQMRWLRGALKFRKEIWNIVGERKDPKIVFEHSGEDTLPTSIFACSKGGMIVLCGGTTGYIGTLDLRYLWLEQKRLQGSHAGTTEDLIKLTKIIEKSNIRPFIPKIYSYNELSQAHQALYKNEHKMGKIAIRIGLKEDEI